MNRKSINKLLKIVIVVVALKLLLDVIFFGIDYQKAINGNKQSLYKVEKEIELAKREKAVLEVSSKNASTMVRDSTISKEDIAKDIKFIINDITDDSLGLFTLTDLNFERDKKYVNLYKVDLQIEYKLNKLFNLSMFENDIKSDISNKLYVINKNIEKEFLLDKFSLDENTKLINLTILIRKKV